ncbi:hypothetical protein AX14_003827 [Amanita brunnescens Koide BX004]|nr:hypothetical protein AX14_003827 [Amanita brunnescens Koide BX004]
MLILQALLFFLLGMSALAIPVPSANGVWHSPSQQSDHDNVIEIDGSKVKVLYPDLPNAQRTVNKMSEIFKHSQWTRMTNDEYKNHKVGSEAPMEVMPNYQGSDDDKLTINFLRGEKQYFLYIKLNGAGNPRFIPIKVTG